MPGLLDLGPKEYNFDDLFEKLTPTISPEPYLPSSYNYNHSCNNNDERYFTIEAQKGDRIIYEYGAMCESQTLIYKRQSIYDYPRAYEYDYFAEIDNDIPPHPTEDYFEIHEFPDEILRMDDKAKIFITESKNSSSIHVSIEGQYRDDIKYYKYNSDQLHFFSEKNFSIFIREYARPGGAGFMVPTCGLDNQTHIYFSC